MALLGIEKSAASVLSRAVEHDTNKRYQSALVTYQEGVQLLLDVLKGTKEDTKRKHIREKVSQYIDRAEKVKQLLQKEKDAGTYHEQIQIAAGSMNHSYEQLFKGYLDEEVTIVKIEDPYIRNTHQVYNFLRFCELLIKHCPNLKKIYLKTGCEQNPTEKEGQLKRIAQLAESISKHNIQMMVDYSTTLHDREIRLDNGWIIKIGRGLDYFRPTENKFSIGFYDQSLRPCHETTVDIFHEKFVKQT